MGFSLRPEPYLARALSASASPVVNAPFTTVLGPNDGQFGPWAGNSPYEGWAVDYSSQPTISSPVEFTCSRQGFDETGAATTYPLESMYVTTTVRQPAPNDASQSANTAALNDYIYSTDTPSGSVTNNSTLTSPKPIAKWSRPARTVVGNSITVGVVTAHRNARQGKQVACVVFSAASAGSGTATATVATPTVLGYINDRMAVIEYVATLDISSFTDSTAFTVDAVVYPWIGAGTTSQRRTVDGTAANQWEFATQTHLKHTSRAANPPLVYVNSSTGVDATVNASGQDGSSNQKVSTTHATAAAVPFQTITSALNALKAATSLTGGFTDGCQVRIQNSTVAFSAPSAGTYSNVGEVIFTRDPDYARAACILTMGGASIGTQQIWLKIKDLTFQRVGANVLNFTSQLVIEDCNFDNGSQGGAMTANSARIIHLIGNTVTNWSGGVLSGGSTNVAGIIRGNTMSGGTIESACLIGNSFTGTTTVNNATRLNNSIIAFNKGVSMTALFTGITGNDVSGYAVVQNILEWTTATTNPMIRFNADAAANNTEHVVMFNNTNAGAYIAGRHNIFYDEAGTARRHRLNAHKGDICTQVNVKGDMFDWYNNGNTAVNPSPRLGTMAYYYGVGCAYNWFQYKTASTSVESQVYAGAGSTVGTSTTVPAMATSKFTAYAAVTYNGTTYSAGAGNGTYTLTSDAPVKGAMAEPVLNYDAAGTARPSTNATIGAYEAP